MGKEYGGRDGGEYVVEGERKAKKTESRMAVEEMFGVKVRAVNTIARKGKRVRTRTGYGKRKDGKRASITLAEGTIDIFNEASA